MLAGLAAMSKNAACLGGKGGSYNPGTLGAAKPNPVG
jgi:hypothetical protein